MIGRESPHDHWADMGLEDEKPRRVDPDPPEYVPALDWCTMSEELSQPDGRVIMRRTRNAVGPDELEFMDAIGE